MPNLSTAKTAGTRAVPQLQRPPQMISDDRNPLSRWLGQTRGKAATELTDMQSNPAYMSLSIADPTPTTGIVDALTALLSGEGLGMAAMAAVPFLGDFTKKQYGTALGRIGRWLAGKPIDPHHLANAKMSAMADLALLEETGKLPKMPKGTSQEDKIKAWFEYRGSQPDLPPPTGSLGAARAETGLGSLQRATAVDPSIDWVKAEKKWQQDQLARVPKSKDLAQKEVDSALDLMAGYGMKPKDVDALRQAADLHATRYPNEMLLQRTGEAISQLDNPSAAYGELNQALRGSLGGVANVTGNAPLGTGQAELDPLVQDLLQLLREKQSPNRRTEL